MKTDLEVEVEVDLRHLGKVIIFRDKQTDRTFLLYIDVGFDGASAIQIAKMICYTDCTKRVFYQNELSCAFSSSPSRNMTCHILHKNIAWVFF